MVPEGEKREKVTENIFEDIRAQNFPNPGKEIDIQVRGRRAGKPILKFPKKSLMAGSGEVTYRKLPRKLFRLTYFNKSVEKIFVCFYAGNKII